MDRFTIDQNTHATIVQGDQFFSGEVFSLARNRFGGSDSVPIAKFFGTRPLYAEGSNPHWRIDCLVRNQTLALSPEQIGKALLSALIGNKFCEEPIWLSWYICEELGGEAFGEVFESEN